MRVDLSAAACATTEPSVFDAYTFPAAQKALGICARCEITQTCLDWVRPHKSFFDGVAGGIVWRNGYKVRTDNSTREDRMLMRRGEDVDSVSPFHGQRALPFD